MHRQGTGSGRATGDLCRGSRRLAWGPGLAEISRYSSPPALLVILHCVTNRPKTQHLEAADIFHSQCLGVGTLAWTWWAALATVHDEAAKEASPPGFLGGRVSQALLRWSVSAGCWPEASLVSRRSLQGQPDFTAGLACLRARRACELMLGATCPHSTTFCPWSEPQAPMHWPLQCRMGVSSASRSLAAGWTQSIFYFPISKLSVT